MINYIIADIILLIHFLIIIFVVSLFIFIPVGYKFNWKFLKNKIIRVVHISLMTIVTIESLIGVHCPLTVLENKFRGVLYHTSLISRILKEIVFWQFPSYFFLIAYILSLFLTIFLWWRYPPINKD